MQKKLIALAIAGLSSAAFAQSNVTVYGVADATFEIAKTSGATASGGDKGSYTRVNSNSSLLGFKGSEALGNGLTAVFQFETGINLDNNTALIGTTRDSFVGLAGGFGTVVLGTLTGPTRGLGSRVDLNAGATGPGANSSIIGKPVGGAGSGVFDTRFSNAAAYVSPTFSGFSGVLGYTTGEDKTIDAATDATKKNLKGWDLGLNYTNGGIDVGYAHGDLRTGQTESSTLTTNTTSSANLGGGEAIVGGLVALGGQANASVVGVKSWKNDRLAGGYTFTGGHKVVALWDHANVKANLGAGVGDLKVSRTTWGIGGKFMVTPADGLIAQYYQAKKLKVDGDALSDSGAKLWEIAYEHSLSKRTILKASYTEMKNQSLAQYDFNVGAVGSTAANNVVAVGADPKVLAVGIRHSF